MNSKNVIELNGNRYDATTGEMLGPASIEHTVSVSRPTPAPVSRSIDGFSMPAATHHPKPAVHHASGASHVQPHQPQSPQTLMRHTVHKPAPGLKTQVTVQHELAARPITALTPKTSVQSIQPGRLERAQTIPQSPQIARYGQPSPITQQPTAPRPLGAVQTPSEQQAPVNQPLDVFERAVAKADNFVDTATEKVHFRKKFRQHALSMSAGALLLLALGGFLTYKNVPSLQLKVASIKAGVPTTMPNFAAAGFSFDHVIQHQPNQITIGFTAKGTPYQIIEQPTNWSGDEMIQTVSSTDASGKPNYTTIKSGNTTIYRIAQNGAAWVAGGKWYQVSGSGTLTDSQLIALVKNV